jgi:Mor family transcriptional regulator
MKFENLDALIEIVGEKKFIEILKIYGGQNVYFPLYKSIIRDSRNVEIVKRFNGYNAKSLACEYNVSVSHIRRIVREDKLR